MTVEQEIAALRAEVAELRRKAQAAQDTAAICNLQAIYGYYVDKTLWDQAADLFAEEATLEIAGRGLFKGRDRVREYLHRLPSLKYGTVFNHFQLQPVIHIADDGETAKGRWRTFIQIGWLGKEARWGEGTYENEYVKRGGRWMILKLHSFITYYVEYDRGWNEGGVPLKGPIEGLVPDEPATIAYEAFPGVFIPPYHYDNPVSGRTFVPGE